MNQYLKISKRWLIVLFFSTIGISGRAQEIKVKAELDTTDIMLGDQIKLRLELEQQEDLNILFPNPTDTLTPNIEIVKRSAIDTVKLENNILYLFQTYTITSFDSGSHVIPSFHFTLDYEGITDSISTNPLTLNVHSFNIDLQKGITDIKHPIGAPLTLKEVSPYILGVILIGAIIFLIIYAIRKRKNKQSLFSRPPKPKEPAHIIALRELERIQAAKVWQQNKEKRYYSEISDVIREYIEDRFNIYAMESTTAEILDEFNRKKKLINPKSFENLEQILTLSDLVKFAKLRPLPDENTITLANAFFFVNQTKEEVVVNKPEEPVDEREGEDVELN